MSIDLYKYHTNPEKLKHYDKAYDKVPHLVWQKYEGQPKELKKREDVLAKDPEIAFNYAYVVLEKPFPKGEDAIAKSPIFPYAYATDVLKGPFKKGEDVIAKDPWSAFKYARNVLNDRFEKGEDAIANDSWLSYLYANEVLNDSFEKGEKSILNSEYADDYKEFLKQKGIKIMTYNNIEELINQKNEEIQQLIEYYNNDQLTKEQCVELANDKLDVEKIEDLGDDIRVKARVAEAFDTILNVLYSTIGA